MRFGVIFSGNKVLTCCGPEIHSSLLVVQEINDIAVSVSQASVFHLLICSCHEGTLDSFPESERDDLVVKGSLA